MPFKHSEEYGKIYYSETEDPHETRRRTREAFEKSSNVRGAASPEKSKVKARDCVEFSSEKDALEKASASFRDPTGTHLKLTESKGGSVASYLYKFDQTASRLLKEAFIIVVPKDILGNEDMTLLNGYADGHFAINTSLVSANTRVKEIVLITSGNVTLPDDLFQQGFTKDKVVTLKDL